MIISVLNCRYGGTDKQIDGFKKLLSKLTFDEARHAGEKVDLPIHSILRSLGKKIIVHPHATQHANHISFLDATVLEPANLNERNKAMVDICSTIIAIPQYMNGHEDSPQWKTIRYAIACEKNIYIISPEGYIYNFIRG